MMAESNAEHRITQGQWALVAIIVALTAGALFYRVLTHAHLEQTAALFLGVPSLLAIVLALQPAARSVTGVILRGITLALLMLAPLLGEGFVCILFAAPLFYAVGVVVGLAVDAARSRRAARLTCVAIVLLPMCLEGVAPQLTFQRTQEVKVRRLVRAPAAAVAERLASAPDVGKPLPLLLRIGFPRPMAAYGSGMAAGSLRMIRFSGAEGRPPGNLAMKVEESRPGYVRFAALGDESKLAHWIGWETSEVSWTPVDATHTAVTWRIRFARQLDPAWYFLPLERAAVHEAALYLIEANATPETSR